MITYILYRTDFDKIKELATCCELKVLVLLMNEPTYILSIYYTIIPPVFYVTTKDILMICKAFYSKNNIV